MINMDYPSINVEQKTNEQNMVAAKSWMMGLLDQLNYQIASLEARVAQLEKGGTNGSEGSS